MVEARTGLVAVAAFAGAIGMQGPAATPAAVPFQKLYVAVRGDGSAGCVEIEAPAGHRLTLSHVDMEVYAPAIDRSPDAFLRVIVYPNPYGRPLRTYPSLIDQQPGITGLHLWSGRWNGPLSVTDHETTVYLCAAGMVSSIDAIAIGTLEPL
jgi:hypothetical protein